MRLEWPQRCLQHFAMKTNAWNWMASAQQCLTRSGASPSLSSQTLPGYCSHSLLFSHSLSLLVVFTLVFTLIWQSSPTNKFWYARVDIVHQVNLMGSIVGKINWILPINGAPKRRFLTDEEDAFSRRGTIKMLIMDQQVMFFAACMRPWTLPIIYFYTVTHEKNVYLTWFLKGTVWRYEPFFI